MYSNKIKKEFKVYIESPIFKKGELIKNHTTSNLEVVKDYRVWWKTILHYLTFTLYKPYKPPYIYTVKLKEDGI
jgi:hypothetical protein